MEPLEQLLEPAAQNGSLPSGTWTAVMEDICNRIDSIVSESFPRISPSSWHQSHQQSLNPSQLTASQQQQHSPKQTAAESQESQVTDKENAPPTTTPQRPPVPPFAATAQPTGRFADAPYTLPPELAMLLGTIKNTLRQKFANQPPYTLQRLAELILWPNRHYRYVGPYLRALDRVVNVSSNVTQYPQANGVDSSLVNGGGLTPPSGGLTAEELGSDESLGGALLTPIPWLANRSNSPTPSPPSGRSRAGTGPSQQAFRMQNESVETIIGPDGRPGMAETVSVGPHNGVHEEVDDVTADQQLKREDAESKSEAEVEATRDGEGDVKMDDEKDTATVNEEDETPHARGPAEITAEDTGKVEVSADGQLDFVKAAGKDIKASPAEVAVDSEPSTGMDEDIAMQPGAEESVEEIKDSLDASDDLQGANLATGEGGDGDGAGK